MTDKVYSLHHLVPRSRIPKEYIEKLNPINTKKKEHHVHETWHKVFSNHSPFEILILCLIDIYPDYFLSAKLIVEWEGIISESFILGDNASIFIKNGLSENKKMLLGEIFGSNVVPLEIIENIIKEWSPCNYFQLVDVMDYRMDSLFYCSPGFKIEQNII